MVKLRPCPFCGREVEIKWNWSSKPDCTKYYDIYGHSSECILRGIKVICPDKTMLIEYWNRRVK